MKMYCQRIILILLPIKMCMALYKGLRNHWKQFAIAPQSINNWLHLFYFLWLMIWFFLEFYLVSLHSIFILTFSWDRIELFLFRANYNGSLEPNRSYMSILKSKGWFHSFFLYHDLQNSKNLVSIFAAIFIFCHYSLRFLYFSSKGLFPAFVFAISSSWILCLNIFVGPTSSYPSDRSLNVTSPEEFVLTTELEIKCPISNSL